MSSAELLSGESRPLAGRTALVTGAARRVGRVIARFLAEAGADVAVHYNSSAEEAHAGCRELSDFGVRARPFAADLVDAAQADALARRVVDEFGGLHVAVLSASVYRPTPLADVTAEEWDWFLNVNLRSVFLVSRAAGLWMREHGGGAIVTIGDWAGIRPYSGYAPYCVSKAGVIALTKVLANELAPQVRVNCVCPGPVLLPEDFSEAERQQVRRQVPLQKIGRPEDVAEAVRFFACGTDFATGAVLTVDGGRLIAEA